MQVKAAGVNYVDTLYVSPSPLLPILFFVLPSDDLGPRKTPEQPPPCQAAIHPRSRIRRRRHIRSSYRSRCRFPARRPRFRLLSRRICRTDCRPSFGSERHSVWLELQGGCRYGCHTSGLVRRSCDTRPAPRRRNCSGFGRCWRPGLHGRPSCRACCPGQWRLW